MARAVAGPDTLQQRYPVRRLSSTKHPPSYLVPRAHLIGFRATAPTCTNQQGTARANPFVSIPRHT